jgi:hypothetical protein
MCCATMTVVRYMIKKFAPPGPGVVLRSIVAKQAITTIILVEPTNDGCSVRIGDELLSSFSTRRQALHDAKKRRAKLTFKGQRSTVVVSRRGWDPTTKPVPAEF